MIHSQRSLTLLYAGLGHGVNLDNSAISNDISVGAGTSCVGFGSLGTASDWVKVVVDLSGGCRAAGIGPKMNSSDLPLSLCKRTGEGRTSGSESTGATSPAFSTPGSGIVSTLSGNVAFVAAIT